MGPGTDRATGTAAAVDRTGTIVVAGTGLAGLRAAETLRAEGFTGHLVMVGDEPGHPYDRPPLSKQYLAGTWGRDRIDLRPADKVDALGLRWRHDRMVACDVEGHAVELASGERLAYDGLVVATGAWPKTFAASGAVTGMHVLRRLADADALAAVLRPQGGEGGGGAAGADVASGVHLVVVGAGFIGTEVAATARRLGATVTVLDPLPTPLARALGPVVGGVCAELHLEHDVDLRTGVVASAVVTTDGTQVPLGTLGAAPHPMLPTTGPPAVGARPAVRGVVLADGRELRADAILVAVGVAPDTGWLQGSGLTLDDGVAVDAAMRAGPGVVAAGDLARWTTATGASLRIEHWTNAAEQGVVAGRTLLAGPAAAPYDPVPYVWSDQYDLKIQVVGLPSADDDVTVVDGSLGAQRFVAAYHRQGRLTGAVGFGRPRQLMVLRPLVQRAAPVAEAVEQLAG